ncbi:hypothetical protein SEPCBS57363_001275 [Sporothrix epigloea]|uniref:DUF8032 domain-containing protein n=1 Tax=Sporothrix epigloea TaxID=1892477 RepID=A0ABP0DBT1_9PEZI
MECMMPPSLLMQAHVSSKLTPSTAGENDDSYSENGQPRCQASVGGTNKSTSLDTTQDARPAHVLSSYGGYHGGTPLPSKSTSVAIAHRTGSGKGPASPKKVVPQPEGLFPEIPGEKKRKFVLVDDRGARIRVRVTLSAVDTCEIPDSFRRSNSVHPSSFFPREMESPPPSPTGRRFFLHDLDDVQDSRLSNDDGGDEVEASSDAGATGDRRRRQHHRQRMAMSGGSGSLDGTTTMAEAPHGDSGVETEVAVPRMRKALRRKQVRINDLACRMAWLQSRAFAGRRIFLQKALDTYRSKVCSGIEASLHDVSEIVPHYELRVGKKQWLSCEREIELRKLSQT